MWKVHWFTLPGDNHNCHKAKLPSSTYFRINGNNILYRWGSNKTEEFSYIVQTTIDQNSNFLIRRLCFGHLQSPWVRSPGNLCSKEIFISLQKPRQSSGYFYLLPCPLVPSCSEGNSLKNGFILKEFQFQTSDDRCKILPCRFWLKRERGWIFSSEK